MKAEHHKMMKRAKGGVVKYDAADSNVEKEAEERKKGGRVKKKHEMKMEGEKPKHRLDRPHRAKGGRVSSDQSPFSSARKLSSAKGHSTPDDCM